MKAIHCIAGVIMHAQYLLYRTSHKVNANNTTFFQNVAQLDIIYASPKHPQSATGLNTAIHSVRGNMTHINARLKIALPLLKHPKARHTPMKNSIAHKKKTPTVTRFGHTDKPITAR